MNRSPDSRIGVAALRPWPFGPPLRGRAPRRDADPPAAPAQPLAPWTAAPVGGLPFAKP